MKTMAFYYISLYFTYIDLDRFGMIWIDLVKWCEKRKELDGVNGLTVCMEKYGNQQFFLEGI